MPASSSPPKGGIREDHLYSLILPYFRETVAKSVAKIDGWNMHAMQEEVQLPEQVGQCLRLATTDAALLHDCSVSLRSSSVP